MATPKKVDIVSFVTVRTPAKADPPLCERVEACVRAHGGRISWRSSERAGRTYASIEIAAGHTRDAAAELRRIGGLTVYDRAIIALAVFPEPAEALPSLLETLGGEGRPDGVLACERAGNALIVEWDPLRTGADVVLALVDTELSRVRGSRTAESLVPVPAELAAAIAARGLGAPEIAPGRILETLLEGAGLT